MTTLLIKNGYVLTLDDSDRVFDPGDVLVRDDRIVAVGPRLANDTEVIDTVIDAAGKLVMPGLVNAHLHSSENLLRGLAAGLPNELWNLPVWPPLGQSHSSPRLLYLNTLFGAMEMVRGGITTVQDQDPAWHQSPHGTGASAFVSAYTDLGMRANIVTDIVDLPWHESISGLAEALSPEMVAELTRPENAEHMEVGSVEDALRVCEAAIQRWQGHAGLITVAIGPSALTRCSEEFLGRAGDLARAHRLPLYLHVLESRMQRDLCQKRYGGATARYLRSIGLLDSLTALVHAVWATQDDIVLFSQAECTVVHSPVSNLYLGSGIMPYAQMVEHGVRLALGTDGMAATGHLSMFENMKLAATLHTAATPDFERWPAASHILRMATYGSARSAGLASQVGALTAGLKADIIVLDLHGLGFTPLNNVVNQLVYSESGDSVETVIINGQVVMQNRQFANIDEMSIMAEIRSYAPRIQDAQAAAWKASQPLYPILDRLYQKSWQTPEV